MWSHAHKPNSLSIISLSTITSPSHEHNTANDGPQMGRQGNTEGGTGWAYKVHPLYFFFFKTLLTKTQHSCRTHWKCTVGVPPPSPTQLTSPAPCHALYNPYVEVLNTPNTPNVENTPHVACFWCSASFLSFPLSRTFTPSRTPTTHPRVCCWCFCPSLPRIPEMRPFGQVFWCSAPIF